MYHIVYTEKAESDFSDIYRYIAEDSTERASAYLSRMEDCILGLRDFPGIGRTGRFPELTSLGVRMLPFEDYLIFYLIREEEDAVVILRVLHSSVNYTVREQYEPAFGGIFWTPCRSSSLQYGGIAASSSRQSISKSTRQKCEAIKSCGFAPRQGKDRRPCRAHGQGP